MNFRLLSCTTALVAFSAACGSSNDGATVSANIKLGSQVTAAASNWQTSLTSMLELGGEISNLAGDVGTAVASDMASLKYKIFGISVCESMTTTATAFSGQTNCLTIYQGTGNNQSGTWAYDLNNLNPAAMVTTLQNNIGEVTDILDPVSAAKLTTGVKAQSSDAHSYNWGVINWYPAIAVRGQVAVGANTLRTLGGAFNAQNQWITSTNMTSGTAADAYAYTGNGGTWFRFQNPLVISADDVKNKADIRVDLAFNPDAYFKGTDAAGAAGCGTCSIKDPAGNSITVPMLDITPIPHKASDTVMRETYLATVAGGVIGEYKLRIQLYYLSSDTNKTIYGVNTTTLLTPNSTKFVYDLSKISFVAANADGTLNFQTWDKSKLIDNFTRKSAVGQTTTAKINCGGLSNGGWSNDDCAAGASINPTFTLTEVVKLK